jgi:lysophospholipase L1-like esterase
MISRSIALVAVLALFAGEGLAQSSPPPCAPAGPGQGTNGDWAFFARYREENASLKPDRSRVVFMGDSITEGWAKQPFFAGNPHYVGRGVGGQTALQMLVRFRADVIALKPRLVHIMAGTNDVAENEGPESDQEIEGAIQSMVELALASHIKVLLASIPPAADFPWHPGLKPIPRIRRLNDWIESYAKHAGVGYVNYWPALATRAGAMKRALSMDGVHPNSEGYRAMAPLAHAAIESALGRE